MKSNLSYFQLAWVIQHFSSSKWTGVLSPKISELFLKSKWNIEPYFVCSYMYLRLLIIVFVNFLFFRFVCFFDLHKTSGQSTLAIHCRIIRIRDGLIFVDSIGSHKQKKKIFVIIIKKSQEFFFFNLFISIMHAFNFNRWLVIRDCQTNCLTMGDFLVH